MRSVQWSRRCPHVPRSLGVVLGSFDPPHLAHGWIARALLERFEQVALLVPAWHFHKSIAWPHHATLQQRMVMLQAASRSHRDRVWVGIAHEVLYVRLAQVLRCTFPAAELGFGMGDESWSRLLDSPAYFERLQLPWTEQDERAVSRLSETSVVFGRRGQPDGVPTMLLPASLRALSSTQLRARVRSLRERGVQEREWSGALQDAVVPEVAVHIARFGLY